LGISIKIIFKIIQSYKGGVMSKKNKHKKHEEEQSSQEQTNNEETQTEQSDNKMAELEQRLEQALRAYATCENDKKIMEKQKTQAIDYAVEKFVKDLLPIIDTLELAVKNIKNTEDECAKELVEGVELTLKKMVDTFKNHGIEAVEHNEFDPNLHQAIQQVASDEHEEGQIVEIYQKGYKLKDRLIRPSMVTICKK
jgi:molecular chaperone GrpE